MRDLTDFLYSPFGLLVCICIAAGFIWLAVKCRDADWLAIPFLCALTMLGGSGWAQKKLQRKRK